MHADTRLLWDLAGITQCLELTTNGVIAVALVIKEGAVKSADGRRHTSYCE